MAVFLAANEFFIWSFPAWFTLFGGEPEGLVTPTVDKWIIEPIATVVAIVQAPTFALYNGSGLDRVQFSHLSLATLWSAISTAYYAPIVLLVMWWRAKRESRGRPTKS
jgi:hypothetical protein